MLIPAFLCEKQYVFGDKADFDRVKLGIDRGVL